MSKVHIDPVCAVEVDEEDARWTSSYKGVTYYFCSKACKEDFDSDPELFLSDVEEDEEDFD
jgi:Cu+-exporting ATPase